jgi:hypothetical protein
MPHVTLIRQFDAGTPQPAVPQLVSRLYLSLMPAGYSQQIDIGPGPVTGFDDANVEGQLYLVDATNGKVRLRRSAEGGGAASLWALVDSGLGQGPVLNKDVACEAIEPQIAIEGSYVIVAWQERCSPLAPWRMMFRIGSP